MSKKNRNGRLKPVKLNNVQAGYLAEYFEVTVRTILAWAETGYDRLYTPEAQEIIKKYEKIAV